MMADIETRLLLNSATLTAQRVLQRIEGMVHVNLLKNMKTFAKVKTKESDKPAPKHRSAVNTKPTQQSDKLPEADKELELADPFDAIVEDSTTASASSRPKKIAVKEQVVAEDVTEAPVRQKKDPKVNTD